MAAQYYKINYKSDFVLTINSDAGWAVPFCIKFWTGMPSHGYFAGFDGENYVNCRVGDTPTQLLVMFDDHHMPIGPLRMQIAYHTTIEEFPDRKFDEVTNPTNVTVDIDGTEYQVMLDFTGESGAEIDFSMPSSGVMSVNGKIGYVTLNAEDVGAQPTIEDLDAIRSGAAAGATAVQPDEMTAALATKQDTISDLSEIRRGAALGATAVRPSELQQGLATKQNVIEDLSTIRSGAAAGATAVQPSALQEGLATKQDVISDLSTIRSGAAAGATAVQPAALTPIQTALQTIEAVIPSAASSQNQLADKNFVNSSIATNTANFVGTYNSLSELQAVQNPTNNDYGFVIETDEQGNEYYDRYKYVAASQQWLFEYKVESTPFTADQWAAIQSGITSALVTKLNALPTSQQLNTQLNGKQDAIQNSEDITKSNAQLFLADRAYVATTSSVQGNMGYKILRKGSTFASQVTAANTIYEIRYDFDLDNSSVTIPAGCTLKFNGGSISNGTLVGNGTSVELIGDGVVFKQLELSGSFNAIEFPINSYYAESVDYFYTLLNAFSGTKLTLNADYTINTYNGDTDDATPSEIYIDGNHHSLTLYTFSAYNVTNVVLKNITINVANSTTRSWTTDTFNFGIKLGESSSFDADGVTVHSNTGRLYVRSASNCSIVNSVGDGSGFFVYECGSVRFEHNRVLNLSAYQALYIMGPGTETDTVTISHNYFKNISNGGVILSGGAKYNIFVEDNVFVNVGSGNATSAVLNMHPIGIVRIKDNKIIANDGSVAFDIDGVSYFNDITDVIVSNNTVFATTSGVIVSIVLVGLRRLRVENNEFVGVRMALWDSVDVTICDNYIENYCGSTLNEQSVIQINSTEVTASYITNLWLKHNVFSLSGYDTLKPYVLCNFTTRAKDNFNVYEVNNVFNTQLYVYRSFGNQYSDFNIFGNIYTHERTLNYIRAIPNSDSSFRNAPLNTDFSIYRWQPGLKQYNLLARQDVRGSYYGIVDANGNPAGTKYYGTTAERPTECLEGTPFYDTTLGKMVFAKGTKAEVAFQTVSGTDTNIFIDVLVYVGSMCLNHSKKGNSYNSILEYFLRNGSVQYPDYSSIRSISYSTRIMTITSIYVGAIGDNYGYEYQNGSDEGFITSSSLTTDGSIYWVDEEGVVLTNVTSIRGTTATRTAMNLSSVNAGLEYYDTTLNLHVVWDGTKWVSSNETPLDAASILAEIQNSTNKVIRVDKDIDLNSATVTVGSGNVLLFDGGSISNGTLTGNNTEIQGSYDFSNVTFAGTFKTEDGSLYVGSNLSGCGINGILSAFAGIKIEMGRDDSTAISLASLSNIDLNGNGHTLYLASISLSTSATVHIKNCVFNCTNAVAGSPVIEVVGNATKKFLVHNCKFTSLTAVSIVLHARKMRDPEITQCEIDGGVTTFSSGNTTVAIFVEECVGTYRIDHNYIHDFSGRGISVSTHSSYLNESASISYNKVSNVGTGGIRIYTYIINNALISHNVITNTNMGENTVAENNSAIAVSGFDHLIIEDNTIDTAKSNAFYIDGSASGVTTADKGTDVTINNNRVLSGVGIDFYVVQDAVLSSNIINLSGGKIIITANNGLIVDNTIKGDTNSLITVRNRSSFTENISFFKNIVTSTSSIWLDVLSGTTGAVNISGNLTTKIGVRLTSLSYIDRAGGVVNPYDSVYKIVSFNPSVESRMVFSTKNDPIRQLYGIRYFADRQVTLQTVPSMSVGVKTESTAAADTKFACTLPSYINGNNDAQIVLKKFRQYTEEMYLYCPGGGDDVQLYAEIEMRPVGSVYYT